MILPENYTIQAELLPLMPFKVFGSNGVHIDQIPYTVDGIDFYGCEETNSPFLVLIMVMLAISMNTISL